MNKTKKLSFYQLDPHYFKDSSGDGVGDFKGLATKIDYFKYLGIDAIILQNILSVDTNEMVKNFTKVSKKLGNIKDFGKVISLAKKQGTQIIIELGIGQISSSHKWFKNSIEKTQKDKFDKVVDFVPQKEKEELDYEFNSSTKSYYIVDEATKQIPLNWKSKQVLEQFVKIVKFWNNLGISGFVFKDFEYLTDVLKQDLMSKNTLKELRKFYRVIKEINDNIILIGKSTIIEEPNARDFVYGPTKVFDYFLNESISYLGTKNMNPDLIGKFSTKKLVKRMYQYINSSAIILSFGSNEVGRITSRWGDNGQYAQESAKALAILLMFTPASSAIYYGDEIGTLNIGLTHLDDFQDTTLNERKRQLQAKGLKEQNFMNAQILQNPINANSLMAWNDKKNGGFSLADKTITPIPYTYREINVKNQYVDKNSTLNFVKKLNKIISMPINANLITNGSWKISSFVLGLVKMSLKYKDNELKIFVNLTNKTKTIKKIKLGEVILSSYKHKTYSSQDLPSSLDAFEAIVISNNELANQQKNAFNLEENKKPLHLANQKEKKIVNIKAEKTKKEKQVAKELLKAEKKFSIMEDEVSESDKTTLTEEEIAATTQINTNNIDDFETFLKVEEQKKQKK